MLDLNPNPDLGALDADLILRGFVPTWVAVTLAVACALFATLAYRREAGRVAAWRRGLLAVIRVGTLAALVALATKPALVRDVRGTKPRPVVILADDSQSMTARDPRPLLLDQFRAALAFNVVAPDAAPPSGSAALPAGTPSTPSRLEVERAILANPRLDLVAGLGERHPVQPSKFGSGRAALDPRAPDWAGALTGTEPRTAMLDAVADLLKRDAADLPAGVVLLTDGRDTASRVDVASVGAECRRLDVPLHVVLVGGSSAGQVSLREAGVPETVYVDDTAVVPVRFRARGATGGSAELTLKLGGREVARKLVDITGGEDQRATLAFDPQKSDALPGKQDLTVAVRVVTDAAQAGDEVVKPVRVIDRKLKVFVAERAPRWDYKFLQRALLRDRRVEARFWLASADREALNSGVPYLPAFPASREELAAFDLVVLGDLPASAFTASQMESLREFVAEGGGLVVIAAPGGQLATWVGTPLADVLPAELLPDAPAGRAQTEAFRVALTPTGARSGALRLGDDAEASSKVWAELPGVYGYAPTGRLKPAAELLATHPDAKGLDGKPATILASHYYGKGYVLLSAIDETWRWRYNAGDKLFGRYWSQLVYLAGAPRTLGTKLTQLALDSPDPTLGESSSVYARLLKPDLTPQTADSVEAVVEKLDALAGEAGRTSRLTLRRLPGQPGEYTAAVPFNRVGKFALKVDNAGNPGEFEYRVALPPDHELSPGGPDEESAAKLAELSGGALYREEDLSKLPAAIAPKSTPTLTREETVLWGRWSFALVLALLTLEWVGRRWVSLS